MQFVLLGLLALAALVLVARGLAGANPTTLAMVVKRTGGAVLVAAAVLLALRGLLPIAAPLLLVGLGLLGLGGFVPGWPFGSGRATPGNTSHVRTGVLAMELDHDSGNMDGEVLTGRFAGKRLSEMPLDDLKALRQDCAAAGDQSRELLEAFLDRHHDGWRRGSDGDRGAPSEGGVMDAAEARTILGVGPDADEAEIRAAHRRLMKLYHPDHGGSSYFAAKINRAKDALLGE